MEIQRITQSRNVFSLKFSTESIPYFVINMYICFLFIPNIVYIKFKTSYLYLQCCWIFVVLFVDGLKSPSICFLKRTKFTEPHHLCTNLQTSHNLLPGIYGWLEICLKLFSSYRQWIPITTTFQTALLALIIVHLQMHHSLHLPICTIIQCIF